MRAWSFSLGRIFGVEVRLHVLLPLVLTGCVLWASILGRPGSRGVILWLLLVGAVLAREIARALARAWYGLDVRSLLLLPTGGLVERSPSPGEVLDPIQRQVLALAGPAASVTVGLLVAGVALSMAPEVDLLSQQWISPAHLLRSAVWINLLMGAINLLPAWPLDGGGELEQHAAGNGAARSSVGSGGLQNGPGAARRLVGLSIAVALVVVGIVTTNWWVVAGGLTALLFAQARRQGLLPGRTAQGTTVSEVMLTDYSVLSASATLEDALLHARHSLQDIYPVVRGGAVVGAISRQTALEAVEAGGNSYVQGAMSRKFQTVTATENLDAVLHRVTEPSGEKVSSLVPVLEGDRIVGILTPEHLGRAVALVNRERIRRDAARIAAEER